MIPAAVLPNRVFIIYTSFLRPRSADHINDSFQFFLRIIFNFDFPSVSLWLNLYFTSHQFLERYDQFLTPEGRLEFKTDNQDLFTFSLEEIENSEIWHVDAYTRDLHHDPDMNEGNIMTEYEEKFSSLGNPICKLIASR